MERPDFLRRVAQVLPLEPGQAVDLDREDQRAEAEGAGQGEAGPARAAHGEARREDDDQRHEDRDQVAPVEVVGAEEAEQDRQRQGGEADPGGDPGAAPLALVAAPEQQRQAGDCDRRRDAERDRPRLADAVLVAVVVADQLGAGAFEPLGERLLGDPAGVGVARLLQRQRQQQRPGDRDRGDRQAGAAPVRRRDQQPDRLRRDHEAGEVVGADRQGREDRPPGEVAAPAAAPRAGEEEEGEGGQQEDQGVGAGVLGEPDQDRADGDHRRRDQPGAARQRQRDRAQVDGDDRGRPRQRRERAQPDFPGAEGARPQPGDQVVEGRGRLAAGDGGERAEQVGLEHPPDRDRLVVAVALQAEGGEAQRRAHHDDPAERHQARGLRRPPPGPLQPRGYGASPPGGGGGGCGGAGA